MNYIIQNLAYLLAITLFIFGLKFLGHPKGAVKGNLLGSLGMLIAIVVTLAITEVLRYEWIIAGILIGSTIGTVAALTIQMTAMPQMVGLFNGLGGAASVLVAYTVLFTPEAAEGGLTLLPAIAVTASVLIGGITFWGSLVAFMKLQGLMSEKPLRYPGEQIIKVIVLLTAVALSVLFVLFQPELGPGGQAEIVHRYFWGVILSASILGILLVIAIGGADMPIVIALLNSYSGLAATATGFALNNIVLIVAGSLVGASGIILTSIMCKAMNRSLRNVLFGGVGAVQSSIDEGGIYSGKIKSTSAEDIALLLQGAQKVAFVPGYGMAVARAQTAVRGLTELLEKDGIEVNFGIHPVAGRMPGHMNVLLAEENISYEKLKDLDTINNDFHTTDITFVVGANDVVNPLAREDTNTPISGMPILNVDESRTVVVIKRSLSPGFAGMPNPLFASDNTLMFFEDGKLALEKIISAYKEL